MKKLIRFLIFLFICAGIIAVLFLIKNRGGEDDPYSRNVYFLKKNCSVYEFIAEKRRIGPISDEAAVSTLVTAFLSGPEDPGLVSLIPSNTTALSVKIINNRVYVNLSDEYSAMSDFNMNLMDYCLIKTLSEIDGISEICIKIKNDPHPISGFNFFSLDSFITENDSFKIVKANTILYYPSENGTGLISSNITFDRYNNEKTEQKLMSALLRGLDKTGGYLPLPVNTKLYSIKVADETAYPDFSEDFQLYMSEEEDSLKVRLTIYSIVNTLTELPYIKQVKFLIEGYPAGIYADMDLNLPLKRDITYLNIQN